jgi:formylglycine-generating enzyme required for sulfatase activity
MPPEPPTHPEENDLIIQPSTGLVSLPEGGSPALSEIINRSLAHIQAGRTLAIPERRAGEEQEFEIAPGVKIVMCWIPPGEFLMGSPEDEMGRDIDEDYCGSVQTQHRVTISQGFWLGKYQVTQAQWEAVTGSNPSEFKGSNLPVETVSWNEISEPGGFMEKVNRFAAAGEVFSLPTEAQWEYACRAGMTTALNSGKSLTNDDEARPNFDEIAWYCENSMETTHPVGQKKSNGWGLHDMHGNVWEWCVDCYGDYPDEPLADPRGPDSSEFRVFRGGCWNSYAAGYAIDPGPSCGVAIRGFIYPDVTEDGIGFRLARSSVPLCDQKCDDVEACVVADGNLHTLPRGIWVAP